MNKTFLISTFCLAVSAAGLVAQDAAPKDDNPLSGLNLNDSANANANVKASAGSSDGLTPSPFVKALTGHLIVMDHGTPKDVDVSTLSNVKYWAFYYSGSWCPSCQVFTPHLVDFYRDFKKSHPNFELIFVDRDPTEAAMLAYMSADEMAWPALKHADRLLHVVTALKQSHGIPELLLTDENGKTLSNSTGPNGTNPGRVIDDIKKMVPTPGT